MKAVLILLILDQRGQVVAVDPAPQRQFVTMVACEKYAKSQPLIVLNGHPARLEKPKCVPAQ